MNGVNQMTLVGTVTQDIELRHAASGTAVANLSVVTNYKPKGGEEVPEYHRCVCFGRTAEVVSEYLRKGGKVAVIGRLQTRSWEKDGVKRYSTEIVVNDLQLLDSKRDNPAQGHTGADSGNSKPAPDGNTSGGGSDGFTDDIPFRQVDGRYV